MAEIKAVDEKKKGKLEMKSVQQRFVGIGAEVLKPPVPVTSDVPLLADELDIVIPTTGKKKLDFLESWARFFQPYHLIIVQDGDPSMKIHVPSVFNFEIFTRNDIERILGLEANCISFNDAACRCFGFLVSKKKYIFTIDDDCLAAMDPSGKMINPVKQHIQNLLTASTPFYFNTSYDPYQKGSEFDFGYPFLLRRGVDTAVSHGLCLNVPHYDAITQLAKPLERNRRYGDAVVTIPKGILYPMSGRNMAFNRKLIGPAMYFGLMGAEQPIARYGDLWAGWCCKVICDHMGWGTKNGLPYVWHNKVNNQVVNYIKEDKGIDWQQEMIQFFQTASFSSECTTVQKCYIELSEQVKDKLGMLDPYFSSLGDAMVTWIEAWNKLNPSQEEARDEDTILNFQLQAHGQDAYDVFHF